MWLLLLFAWDEVVVVDDIVVNAVDFGVIGNDRVVTFMFSTAIYSVALVASLMTTACFIHIASPLSSPVCFLLFASNTGRNKDIIAVIVMATRPSIASWMI